MKCPICTATLKRFKTFRGRKQEQCPSCLCLRRHRVDSLWWDRVANLGRQPGWFLHMAPEKGLYRRWRAKQRLAYVTCDLRGGARVNHKVNIEDPVRYRDGSFDYVYSSHVLEHVVHLGKALAGIYRIMAPGGTAVLQVPLRPGPTLVDPRAVDQATRKRYHGHPDHRRHPGTVGWPQSLRDAGFVVEVHDLSSYTSVLDRQLYGLHAGGAVHVARKPI